MADPIKVEKGIPMPTRRRYGSWGVTLKSMAIGDSFEIPNNNSAAAVYKAAKTAGIEIATRTYLRGGQTWRRVWRVK